MSYTLPYPCLHTIVGRINFDTVGAATGVVLGTLPAGCVYIGCDVIVSEAFNAASTNVLVVGTDAEFDNFIAAGTVNEAATGLTASALGAAEVTADTVVKAKYTQTGTAATAGKAIVVLKYARTFGV